MGLYSFINQIALGNFVSAGGVQFIFIVWNGKQVYSLCNMHYAVSGKYLNLHVAPCTDFEGCSAYMLKWKQRNLRPFQTNLTLT
jgi:hypothetical protein